MKSKIICVGDSGCDYPFERPVVGKEGERGDREVAQLPIFLVQLTSIKCESYLNKSVSELRGWNK